MNPLPPLSGLGDGEFLVQVIVNCGPGSTQEDAEEYVESMIGVENTPDSEVLAVCVSQLSKSQRGRAALAAFIEFTEAPCMGGLDSENHAALMALLGLDRNHHLKILEKIQTAII